MTITGWLQISLVLGLALVAVRPLGLYMAAVFEGRRTFMTPCSGLSSAAFTGLPASGRNGSTAGSPIRWPC